MYKYCVYPDELYHFGVKGMKWGVRRAAGPGDSNSVLGWHRTVRYANAKQKADYKANQLAYKAAVKSGESRKTARQTRNAANLRADINRGNTMLNNTTVKQQIKSGVAGAAAGTALAVAGHAIANSPKASFGQQMVGSFLEGAGKGIAVGQLASSTINAGIKYVDDKKRRSK